MATAAAVTGAQIAADARKYRGQGYVYGGPAARPGDWDCSSFVSYVLGHDLGMGLPGGVWGGPGMPPAVHGPVVLSYAGWSQADPVPSGQQQPGDLVCWLGVGTGGHIGIVLGPDQMVSALNPQLGTLVSPITGYGPTNTYVFRRVHGTGEVPAQATAAAGGAGVLSGLLVGALAGAGALGVVAGLAAAAAAAALWALTHVVSAVGSGYGAT